MQFSTTTYTIQWSLEMIVERCFTAAWSAKLNFLINKLTWWSRPSIQNTPEPCHWSHSSEVDSQSIPTHNYTIIDEVNRAIIGVTRNHHPPSENWPSSIGGCCNYSHPVHSPSKISKCSAAIWTCCVKKNQQIRTTLKTSQVSYHYNMQQSQANNTVGPVLIV